MYSFLRLLVVGGTLSMLYVMADFLQPPKGELPFSEVAFYYALLLTPASPILVGCMYYLNRKLAVWFFLLFPALNVFLIIGLIGGLRALA